MQKTNNISNKSLDIKQTNVSNDSIKELVVGFSKEKYNIEKTKEEKKIFKKQLITLIFVIFIAIGTIVGASFAIYYAYKNEHNQKQNTISLIDKNNKIN